jgi:hypothetical protein
VRVHRDIVENPLRRPVLEKVKEALSKMLEVHNSHSLHLVPAALLDRDGDRAGLQVYRVDRVVDVGREVQGAVEHGAPLDLGDPARQAYAPARRQSGVQL